MIQTCVRRTRLTISRATGVMLPAPPSVPGTSTTTWSAPAGPICCTQTRSYFAGPGPGGAFIGT